MFKLTLKYIKGYKKNTITNIIGIAFSIMLIFSLVGLSDKIITLYRDTLIHSVDYFDEKIINVEKEIADEVYDDVITEEEAKYYAVNCGTFCYNEKEYCSMIATKDDWLYMNKYEVLEGREPENAYEACIEYSFALKYDINVNDVIKGELYINDEDEYSGELKVVGIVDNKEAKAGDYYILTAYSTALDLNEKQGMNIGKDNIEIAVLFDIMGDPEFEKSLELSGIFWEKYQLRYADVMISNDAKLKLLEEEGTYSSSVQAYYAICIVVIICMIIFIYNTISIGMTEKIRQYGTLRCIGIDNKKLIYMVMMEELIYSAAGTIIGIVCGKLLNEVLVDYAVSNYIPSRVAEMEESPIAYVITCVVMIAAVCIASFGMLIKMRKLQPIQMLRYTEKNRIHKCKKEYKSLIMDIANRNLKRTPSKSRILAATIAIASLLILTIGNVLSSIEFNINKTISAVADFEVAYDPGNLDVPYITEEVKKMITEHPNVEETYWQRHIYCSNALFDDKPEKHNLMILIYSENMMDKFLDMNKLDKLKEKEEIVVYFDRKIREVESVKVGPEEYGEVLYDYTIKPDACLKTAEALMTSSNLYPSEACIIVNEKVAEKIMGKVNDYSSVIIKSDGSIMYEDFVEFLGEYDFYCINIQDMKKEAIDQLVEMAILAGYMVISVVILSMFVVSNIIKSNVTLRTKEIGMLRSVGAEKKWIEKLFVTEIMISAIKGIIIGAVISILPSGYMYFMIRENLGIGYAGFVVGIPVIIIGVYLLTRRIVKKSLKAEIADIIRYE